MIKNCKSSFVFSAMIMNKMEPLEAKASSKIKFNKLKMIESTRIENDPHDAIEDRIKIEEDYFAGKIDLDLATGNAYYVDSKEVICDYKQEFKDDYTPLKALRSVDLEDLF